MSTTTKTAPAKKTTSSKATKPAAAEKTPREPKLLRAPQIRILEALSKAKNGLTRKELVEKKTCDPAWVYVQLGSSVAEKCAFTEEKYGVKSLATMKAVKFTQIGGPGEEVNEERVEITATGKQILVKASK